MEMTPGFLARSIAGNDKDKIYVISEDLGTTFLCLQKTAGSSGKIKSMSRSLRNETGGKFYV